MKSVTDMTDSVKRHRDPDLNDMIKSQSIDTIPIIEKTELKKPLVMKRSADKVQTPKSKFVMGTNFMHSWEIDHSELEYMSVIGEGTFSTVHLGKYRQQPVAIKVCIYFSVVFSAIVCP
eukprot:TRINITY_DN1737_c0_g2_i2.p2 TRINITY_DN1737_c0_g2~~TRINITY_DN1737_c0_g2_i2.p2  ORF type:complete len:119 (-),score=24.18 TRINITY_DN1737_c0_g2_i2:750-1106(-)